MYSLNVDIVTRLSDTTSSLIVYLVASQQIVSFIVRYTFWNFSYKVPFLALRSTRSQLKQFDPLISSPINRYKYNTSEFSVKVRTFQQTINLFRQNKRRSSKYRNLFTSREHLKINCTTGQLARLCSVPVSALCAMLYREVLVD